MGKELCFCVENKNLYLEQVLVDYMGIPVFFLCKDDSRFYVVLCTDFEESNYIIVQVTASAVYSLLHGKIPMRNIILDSREYWEVISGKEIALDTVTQYAVSHLDVSQLPEEHACFQILTKEMEAYVQKFDSQFFSDTDYDAVKENTFERIPFECDLIYDIGETKILIENFKNIGDYFVRAIVKKPAETVIFEGEYTDRFENTVVLQQPAHLDTWNDEEILAMAA